MRGAIELPAVAIFTVVAGGLIIFLFVAISNTQGEQAAADTQARSLQFIDTLLKTASTARETKNNITIIDEPLRFICDESGAWFGYTSGVQLPLHRVVVFSQRELDGGQVLFFTKGSDVPFRATNVLYIGQKETVIYNALDSNAGVDLSGFAFPTETGAAPSMRFRTLRSGSPTLANELGIIPELGTTYGTVEWFTGTSVPAEAVYPNAEMLYGAILSKDKETYECALKQYLAQVRFVNKVQWNRVKELRAAESASCQTLYYEGPFATIDAATQKQPFDLGAAEDLAQAKAQIQFMNNNLLLGDACAAIY